LATPQFHTLGTPSSNGARSPSMGSQASDSRKETAVQEEAASRAAPASSSSAAAAEASSPACRRQLVFERAAQVVAVYNYRAEAGGYLSVRAGDVCRALMDTPEPGDANCHWPCYVVAQRVGQVGDDAKGWVPIQALWFRYKDEDGRCWLDEGVKRDEHGAHLWCWEDELRSVGLSVCLRGPHGGGPQRQRPAETTQEPADGSQAARLDKLRLFQ